jgi:hypothetical protein
MIPSKAFVVNEILKMSTAIPELNTYTDTIVSTSEPNCLYLLSNLSASGLLSEENEAKLYIEIIQQVTPPGGIVLLKSHPRAPKSVLNRVADCVSQQFKTIVIENEELVSYPIELWSKLLGCCEVIPVYSASAYQIKYIYGKQVILTLDEGKIIRYAYPGKRKAISIGNQSIISCVNKIDTWDGKSPLWKG